MEFRKDGTLGVSMVAYLKNVIAEFPVMVTGKAPTPAADHLFKIRDAEEAKPLEEEKALAFHHRVAQLLFMAFRAQRDIQTTVAFLTTRVKSPNEDDWGKLKRVLKYLNGTKYLKLTLSVGNLGVLKWYIDESHNVHWDCKGHGGGAVHHGKGSHFKLFKKSEAEYLKLNQDGISDSGHVYAQKAVDTIFCSESGIRSRVHWFVPRQYQRTTLDEERTLLEWQEDKAHQS
jgi:hypothetical protein